MIFKSKFLFIASLVAGSALSIPSPAEWISAGTLTIPKYSYNFLAATSNGNLVAGTFNNRGLSTPSVPLPALLISNPGAGATVTELCRIPFDAQRGYSGIACEASGAFFVSGDTGEASTSFIRKFNADGTPAPQFGAGGEVKPGRRCLGMDVLGKHLLVAHDWAIVNVYDTASGKLIGSLPKPASGGGFMRDITIDPKSMRVFGVAQGGVSMWGGGAPWNPTAYTYQQFSTPVGEPKAGEGISIDPLNRSLLVLPHPGRTLLEIYGNKPAVKSDISSANDASQLCDSALSFDGSTLFISDQQMLAIHVMKRATQEAAITENAVAPAATVAPGTAAAPPVQWARSYTDAVEPARVAGKPMIVYFRKPGFKLCEELEKNLLLTNEFNSHAQKFVCVFEDASANRLLAYKFGVFRVPQMLILDAKGETVAEFKVNIDGPTLFKAMDSVK
ncbi:hypothetical protein BH09SUM1_BH09SUM1_11490 [soil metagenome]